MNKNDILEFRINNKLNELKSEYDELLELLIEIESDIDSEDNELRNRLYEIKTKMFLLQDILTGE